MRDANTTLWTTSLPIQVRADEVIDVESVAIRDGGFGCEGRYGAR